MATRKSTIESNGSTSTAEMPAPHVDIVGITKEHATDSLLKQYNDAKAIRGRVILRGEQFERTGRANIKDGSVKGRTSYKSYCDTNEEIRAFDLCSQVEAYAAACVGIMALTRYDVRHEDAPSVHVAAFKARAFKKAD